MAKPTAKQSKKQSPHEMTKHLKVFQWKKGQSGNAKGRPPGKSLKAFAREYLEALPDDDKLEYLASLPAEIVWRMAEGNPQNDVVSNGETIQHVPILGGLTADEEPKT